MRLSDPLDLALLVPFTICWFAATAWVNWVATNPPPAYRLDEQVPHCFSIPRPPERRTLEFEAIGLGEPVPPDEPRESVPHNLHHRLNLAAHACNLPPGTRWALEFDRRGVAGHGQACLVTHLSGETFRYYGRLHFIVEDEPRTTPCTHPETTPGCATSSTQRAACSGCGPAAR